MKNRIPFVIIAAMLFVAGCSGLRNGQHVAAGSKIPLLTTVDPNNPSNWYDFDPAKHF